jgi:hypothetical protein
MKFLKSRFRKRKLQYINHPRSLISENNDVEDHNDASIEENGSNYYIDTNDDNSNGEKNEESKNHVVIDDEKDDDEKENDDNYDKIAVINSVEEEEENEDNEERESYDDGAADDDDDEEEEEADKDEDRIDVISYEVEEEENDEEYDDNDDDDDDDDDYDDDEDYDINNDKNEEEVFGRKRKRLKKRQKNISVVNSDKILKELNNMGFAKFLSKKIAGVRTYSAQETMQILSKSACFLAFLYNNKYSNHTLTSDTITHIMRDVVKYTYLNVTIYLDYLGDEGYKASKFLFPSLLQLFMTLHLTIVCSNYRSHSAIYRYPNEMGTDQGHELLAKLLVYLSTCY